MPLQRPANHSFSEAATQFRRYHVWPVHETNTTAAASTQSSSDGDGVGDGDGDAASSTSSLRRPSMRPLDYRWDRSRGIIFSGHHQRRSYASKPIQRSTPASTPAAAPTKGFGPSSAASAVDSGWKGGPYSNSTGYSFKQGKDLEKKNRDLNDEIKGLNAKLRDHKAKTEAVENQLGIFKSQNSELENKLRSAESKAKRDLRALEVRHLEKLDSLGPRIAENQSYLDDFRRNTQAPLYVQINDLNDTISKLQRDAETSKTAMEDQQKRHETTQRNAMAHSRDLRTAFDKASKELQGVRARKQEDREDYTRYQAVFADLNDKLFEARDEIHHTRRRVDEESLLWQKSLQRFRMSDDLRLFLYSSKYAGTKKAIEEFLQEQVTHAKTTNNGLRQLELQLTQHRKDMQPIAHESRALTRHHQLDEHQSAYNSAHLAQRLATSVPFQELRKAYTEEIEQLEDLIDESTGKRENGDVVEKLKSQMQDLLDQRRKVQRFLTFFGFVQNWRALEALRDDDAVEKAVWVDTIKAKQALDAAVERFFDEVEDRPFRNAEEWTRRNNHRDDVRAQRMEFDYLVAQVRQRHLLANDLGKVTEKEKSRVEATIKRQTELAKSAVDGSLAGLGFQKPAARRRTSIQKSDEATTTTADAPSKTAPTIDTLRASLLTDVATKKKRAAKAEKKPTVLKKAPRRVPSANRKRRFAAVKVIAINSSDTAKPSAGSAADGKPKDKGKSKDAVGGNSTAASTFKPTEARQAPQRQPSYNTEARASNSGSRASRGDSMGFSTLKAALTPPFAANRESEGPTGAMDDASNLNPAACSTNDGGDSSRPTPDHNSTFAQPPKDDAEASTAEDTTSAYNDSNSETATEADEATAEEPQTELSYQISAKDFRDAAMASPNTNAAYWSHNLYKNAENQKPVVYYCQSYDATEARAKLFLDEPVIGFDLEWEAGSSTKAASPDIKRNISLIQIAAEDKIGLFQLARFKNAKTADQHMPPSLRKLLESSDIIKAGVNISGDSTRMKKCLGVEMKGIFELSHMFRVVKQSKKFPVSFRQVSLSQQVQDVLLLPMKKDDVRVSAWSKELNMQQTSYAAADAYAGFQLFHRLDNARKKMVPKPPRPALYETFQPLVLGDGTMVLRSSDASGRKRGVVKKGEEVVGEVAEENEEEEEFFDAPEGLDTYELGAEPEISGSISNPDGSDAFEPEVGDPGSHSADRGIFYPSLPKLDRESGDTADSASDPSAAPSRTTTKLPFRAKLSSKIPPPQPTAPLTSTEEEEIQANRSATQNRPGPLPCPEIQAAETWIITYRSKHDNSVGTATLRAYHLWHYQQFTLKEVAGFCRDPPLAMTTVASYIMQALNSETGLPFEGGRVKEVLGVLPGSVHGRYRGVLERGGGSQG